MQKPVVLVTGSSGQVGSELRSIADAYAGYDFVFTDRESLSIIDEQAILACFEKYQPHYCINCAAYTAVDKAEDPAEYEMVKALNADAVGYLAKASDLYQTKFIHLSTDYVFDGNGSEPYKEDDPTEPASVYGVTKLQGEKNALQFTDAIVIRTSWVYSSYGKNFVKTMMRLMNERNELNVVCDQYGSPTYAADLAEAIMKIISMNKWHSGIYHYSNKGETNWYEFALAIKQLTGATCALKAIPTSAYPTAAKRPEWSVLSKQKIIEQYQIIIPNWEESLKHCIDILKSI